MAMTPTHGQDAPRGVTKRCGSLLDTNPKKKNPLHGCKDWYRCPHPWGVVMDGGKWRPLTPYLKLFALPLPMNQKAMNFVLEGGKGHPGYRKWYRDGHATPAVVGARRELDTPVSVFAADYITQKIEKGNDKGSKTLINHLTEAFGTQTIQEFAKDARQIITTLDRLEEEGDWGPTYWRKHYNAWVAWFKWTTHKPLYNALENPGVALKDPFRLEDEAAGHPVKFDRQVNFGNILIEKILDNADELMQLRILGAIHTCYRRNELLQIQVKEWLPDTLTFKVAAWKTKAKRLDRVPLETEYDRRFLKALNARLKVIGDNPDAFIFGHPDGRELTTDVFRDMWPAVFKASGITNTTRKLVVTAWDKKKRPVQWEPAGKCWHDLRHEGAFKYAIFTQGNPMKVRDRMRLSDLKTLDFYCKHYTEYLPLYTDPKPKLVLVHG